MRLLFTFAFLSLLISTTSAQITIGQDTLVGNEWVQHDQTYHKMMVSEDGWYRVGFQELIDAGISSSDLIGNQLQVFHFGEERAINVSTNGAFSASDYIEFYGVKNRGELDQYLYRNTEDQLNPLYSSFTDTSAYFITTGDISGKRYGQINTDITNNNIAPEPYYMHRDVIVNTSSINKPSEQQSIRYSQFVSGEGYSGNIAAVNNVIHNTSNVFSNGPTPSLYLRISGNNLLHTVDVSIKNEILATQNYIKGTATTIQIPLSFDLVDNSTTVNLTSRQSSEDKNTVANSILTYPRTFDFGGSSSYEFNVGPSSTPKYIEIENSNTSGELFILDKTNNIIFQPLVENSVVKVILPADVNERNFIFINKENSTKSVDKIVTTEMVNYSEFGDTEFIIYSSKVLDKNHTDGVNYLRAYADHRASTLGGSLNSTIVFAEDLYDQFAYGLNKHTLAFKNFTQWNRTNWNNQKYNFIVGKGIEYAATRSAEQINDPDPLKLDNLVPTFGLPGSDNTLLSKKNHSRPNVPTGRIAVNNVDQIKIYYDKITLRENPNTYPQTIEGKAWTKRILHLAGGDPNIQELIRNSLTNMGQILVNSKFGADIEQIEKRSSDNIETPITTQILNSIDSGVSILAFFGHSSAGTFDLSIEKASEYNNKGKLPIVLSMGCFSGNIYTTGESLSEDFVLEEDVGSIAFMAASGSAYISPQGDLGQRFYTELSNDLYGAKLGDIVNKLLIRNDTIVNNSSLRTLNEQFTLHGDPALSFNAHEGPDYLMDFASTETDPKIIAPENTEFNLIYDVVNIGQGVLNDSLSVKLIHDLPDGSSFDTIIKRIKAPTNRLTDTLILTNPKLLGIGENCIRMELDFDNEIEEIPNPIAEQNNTLGYAENKSEFCFFILDNSANPVFPEKFAIVNGSSPKLIASTSNVFATDRNYIMEIDTTTQYNSPLKQETEFVGSGGSLNWEPSIDFVPGEVYYWRVSPDSTDVNIGFQWKESSFIYLPNSSDGWNQSHYFQFLENNLDGIDYENRKLDFINQGIGIYNNLQVPNFAASIFPRFIEDGFTPGRLNTWTLDKDGIAVSLRDNGINIWQDNASPGLHGSVFTSATRRVFHFPTDNQQSRIDLVNFLEDIVEEGYHAFVYTVTNSIEADLHIEDWALDSLVNNNRNIFNVLEKQGATLVRQLEDKGTVPYGMIYTKNENIVDENIGDDILDVVTFGGEFMRNYIEGDLSTSLIGPALSWDKLLWNVEDNTDMDTFMLYIKGVKPDGGMDTLFTVMEETEVDLSGVDTEQYPHLRLELYTKDDIDRNPVNVNFWRVLYTGSPEAVINKDDTFVFNSDTLQQGQTMEFAIKTENITSNDMDSLLVKYTITNDQNESIVNYERLKPLLANQSQLLSFNFNTKEARGKHQFNFEINPNKDQIEKFAFNNFGVKEFFVQKDSKDPIMDVSFDGVHIIDGELVSTTPFILITVKDDNQYLLLDDPTAFQVALIYPDKSRKDFTTADNELSFEPANSTDNNQAQINLEPLLDQEGEYTLIVQTQDASGNFSGANGYTIKFNVVLEESVSNVLNYPNPFSTQTQFVFTLTGSQVPDDISISILTVSGKVVKEISREELGPLKIGVNRTEYKWTGVDDYGEKLANGVYLYKVNLPADMKRYETSADQFFTEGYGKLVIMR